MTGCGAIGVGAGGFGVGAGVAAGVAVAVASGVAEYCAHAAVPVSPNATIAPHRTRLGPLTPVNMSPSSFYTKFKPKKSRAGLDHDTFSFSSSF